MGVDGRGWGLGAAGWRTSRADTVDHAIDDVDTALELLLELGHGVVVVLTAEEAGLSLLGDERQRLQ